MQRTILQPRKLRSIISTREAHIGKLKEELADLRRIISKHNAAMREKDAEITRLWDTIRSARRVIESLWQLVSRWETRFLDGASDAPRKVFENGRAKSREWEVKFIAKTKR